MPLITFLYAGIVSHLDLSDDEAAALTADITANDRYPFSEGIRPLTANLAKLRPKPAREPSPVLKNFILPEGPKPKDLRLSCMHRIRSPARGVKEY
jgi:hypothetical protein